MTNERNQSTASGLARLVKTERTLVWIRWAGVVFGLAQALAYYRPYPEGVLPAAVVLLAFLAIGNAVISRLIGGTMTTRKARQIGVAGLALDTVVVMGLVFAYTFDPNTAMWAVVYILPLEGAARFQLRGALVAMAVATVLYAVREAYGSAVYGNDFLPASITFRMGIGFIIGMFSGATASSLIRERREFESLAEALETAQRVAHIGSWSWDIAANSVAWSDELYRLFGHQPGSVALTYESYLEMVHGDDRSMIQEVVGRSFGTGEAFAFDHRVVWPDGTVRWIHGRGEVVMGPDGKAIRMLGTAQDITETRLAHEARRASEEKFRTVAETATDGIVSADGGGRIVYVNPAAERMFGYRASEAVGQPLTMLMPQRFREPHLAGLRRFLTTGRARVVGNTVELVGRRRDGTEFPVELSLTTWPAADGLFFTGIVRDVTERKRAEDALKKAYDREHEAVERLRALDEMKNSFLSAVSHELRTPLTSVLGFAHMLEEPEASVPPKQRREVIGRIAANARKLDRLLTDLLDLDRLARGIVEPNRRAADLAELVRRVVEETDVGDRPVEVEVEPIVANIDSAKVERIIENLLRNAAIYTPPGTPVWVRVRSERGGMLIVVEDAGPGISREERQAIFEPFHKGERISGSAAGTGIGLSLVARFAELHGGRAWVEDRTGGGSSFRVFLPSQLEARAIEPAL